MTTDLFQGVLPFLHTAEERSFRRAGERLGVTSAAISKAVLKLEDELGVRLLVRTSRSVSLTPEGAELLARAREAVSAIQAGREAASAARRGPRGEVHVSAPPVLSRLTAPVLALLAERHPALGFRVSFTDRRTRFAEEGVDVALRLGPVEDSSLVARRVRATRWVTVASPGFVARHGRPTSVEALGELDALLFVGPNGKPRAWAFDQAGATVTPRLRARARLDHGPALLDAALAGLGVAQLLDFMIDAELRAGRLLELLPELAAEGPPIHALAPAARARSANVRAVIAALLEVARG